jgi:hypothetical protein
VQVPTRVDGGGWSARKLAREADDHFGGDTADLRNRPRGKRPGHLGKLRHALHRDGHRGEVLGEEGVHDPEQQERIGSRADEQVLVGKLGGAGTARIGHHELAAALAERLQPSWEVGRGAQRAVGFRGIGAEHEQIAGAVQVGH